MGLGPVRVAAYLMPKALPVRHGPNEVRYADGMFWAERLDKGALRVLTMNLALLLPRASIKPYPWRADELTAEILVDLGQFDVDRAGEGVLDATWRINVPGEEPPVRSGRSQHRLLGPPPDSNPDGAVATLSALLGKLTEELADAVTQALARRTSDQTQSSAP